MKTVLTRKDLEGKTIMELRSFAKEREIPLRRNWKKDEIIQAILRMIRPKRGRKPKPVQRTTGGRTDPKPPSKRSTGPDVGGDTAEGTRGRTEGAVQRSSASAPHHRADNKEATTDEVSLMVRNSDTLFAYWRTGAPSTDTGRGGKGEGTVVLRIHDVSGSANGLPGKDVYEIPVEQTSGTLYISLRVPGHTFLGELGYTDALTFRHLASSKAVETPPDLVLPRSRAARRFFQVFYNLPEGVPLRLRDIPAVYSDDT